MFNLPSRRSQLGFTLVEVIVSAGLLGFLALTATFFWVDGLGMVRTVNNDSVAIADSRAILERLAREVREVKLNLANGAYCVSTLSATQMVFNKTSGALSNGCGGAMPTDTNADFAVTINHSGTTLTLGYAGTLAAPAVAGAVLTDRATAFGIRYLDGAFATTASTTAMRYVELSLTLQPSGGQDTQSRTVVALRNN